MNKEIEMTTGAHFGIGVSFDMDAKVEVEEDLIIELENEFKKQFLAWQNKAEQAGVKIGNVIWE